MAKSSLYLPILFICFLILSFNSGGTMGQSNGMKTWCVAKPSASKAELVANIDYACHQVNCDKYFCETCPCKYPNTLLNKASVAMNLYYQTMGRNEWNCNFRSSGLIVISNPSYGLCSYDSILQ